uniref:Putative secreted protein n=1 Tax=Ixodes scapularis TaxID=6945 RepID=A0A4D5RHI1_IXOSC
MENTGCHFFARFDFFFLLICMVVQCLVNGWRKLRRNVVVESSVVFFSFRSCARVHPIFIAKPQPQPVSWLGLSCDERISLDGEIKLCGIEMGSRLVPPSSFSGNFDLPLRRTVVAPDFFSPQSLPGTTLRFNRHHFV